MRTFIAVPLPEECLSVLERMQSRLRPSGADVRWIPTASLHLTLKFLGEIDRGLLPELGEALRISADRAAFSLSVHELGGFPNLYNPRVIWCGVHGDTERLADLQAAVEKACEGLGFPREERPFHPHLTLGRVQGKRNLQALRDCIKIGEDTECTFTVNHFDIYQSVLTPRGAVYTILRRLPLK